MPVDQGSGTIYREGSRYHGGSRIFAVPLQEVESANAGHVRLIPSQKTTEDFIEIEGSPGLIVEIVSDSSIQKDTRDLPVAYYTAGVQEYWITDARSEELVFQIHHRGSEKFEPTKCDPDGYQQSTVFNRRFRLERGRDQHGFWRFELIDHECL